MLFRTPVTPSTGFLSVPEDSLLLVNAVARFSYEQPLAFSSDGLIKLASLLMISNVTGAVP